MPRIVDWLCRGYDAKLEQMTPVELEAEGRRLRRNIVIGHAVQTVCLLTLIAAATVDLLS